MAPSANGAITLLWPKSCLQWNGLWDAPSQKVESPSDKIVQHGRQCQRRYLSRQAFNQLIGIIKSTQRSLNRLGYRLTTHVAHFLRSIDMLMALKAFQFIPTPSWDRAPIGSELRQKPSRGRANGNSKPHFDHNHPRATSGVAIMIGHCQYRATEIIGRLRVTR
jgi:hypothetical protein